MRTAKRIVALLALCLLAATFIAPGSAQASFGIKSFTVTAENEDGTTDFQAGSHPYELDVHIVMNTHEEGGHEFSDGTLRALTVNLPQGLLGDPLATPRCTRSDFEGFFPHCPADTVVGYAFVPLAALGTAETAVYNIVPPLGVPATIGFSLDKALSLQEASLRSSTDFGVDVSDSTIPTNVPILAVDEHVWGVPADESHRPERECVNEAGTEQKKDCPTDSPLKPFLSLPTSCGEPLKTTVSIESLQEPGVLKSATAFSEEGGVKAGIDGCNALDFEPQISFKPTTNRADSPSGLDVDVHQPQHEACGEEAGKVDCEDSTSQLKDFTATLPKGLAVNPSAANGLGACSESQIGYQPWEGKVRFSKQPQSCPDASKIGTIEVSTPLVDHPLGGAVYLAQPYQNPFGSLLAIYLAVEDPQTGTIAKLAGKVEPNPQTGQLTATVDENPQLPLEDVRLHFFEGARGSLRTPLACGTYTTTSDLTPWSSPEGQDAHPTDSFQITQAAGSGGCPSSEGAAPNDPTIEAGTVSPQAGAYSPFVFKLARPDGSQPISKVDISLPAGLTGRLAGIPYCPEADIAQAKSREKPEMGRLEQQSPSCPTSSEVGTITVGAGAGPAPFYAQGHAYLAGPYEGAPISFVFVVPAVAGPFDLGDVVSRAAAYVNPETAKITVRSDPLPTALDGIPLDVRSIAVSVNRPDFTLNPTSCDPMSLGTSVLSSLGNTANLSNRFQVGGCASLPYQPGLSARLSGPTKRGRFPALKATLTAKAGEANTASLAVTLPHSEFLEQGHFGTICTRVQFAANQCPPASVYGSVKVQTPLLSYPLEGPVYLRSSSHNLPDLVLVLRAPPSQPIEVTLDGRIDSKNSGIRTTFEAVPDAPFSEATLTMPGGKKGLLVNSTNVCASVNRATVRMTGQNGKTHDFMPAVVNPKCKGVAHKKKKGHGKKKHKAKGKGGGR